VVIAAISSTLDLRATWRQAAAERATEWVRSGMVIGLGAGSTAAFALRRIAELLARGALTGVVAVPCSREVAAAAARHGIPLTTLEAHPSIDITIDGADEVDPSLALIKGAGGAMLHEKIVAQASRREVIVVDATKQSRMLGTRRAVPVEVVPFGWRSQARFLESLGARVQPRIARDRTLVRTEHGNYILDCAFGVIRGPHELARVLAERAGIVEHGLFLDLTTDLIVADAAGTHLYTRERPYRRLA
jgi:ribose 5-phosphate isomerase A